MKRKITLLAVLACSLFAFSVLAQTANKADQNKILTIKTDNQAQAVGVTNQNQKSAVKQNTGMSSFKTMQAQMERMQQQVNKVVNDPSLENFYSSKNPIFNTNIVVPSKYPQVKFDKTDTDYILQLVTPGMDKKDLSVTVSNNVITVSGKNSAETKKEKGKKVVYNSMSTSQFSQSFTLPNDADANKISSTYKNGVLNIKIPIDKEKAKHQVKAITIN
ncbi:MAG TPA: Hsp20/alpha crystallin family protein [Victivallales bacterium]|nr:Hsp20/alpha crystallin family protein [Victivallales bacterium]